MLDCILVDGSGKDRGEDYFASSEDLTSLAAEYINNLGGIAGIELILSELKAAGINLSNLDKEIFSLISDKGQYLYYLWLLPGNYKKLPAKVSTAEETRQYCFEIVNDLLEIDPSNKSFERIRSSVLRYQFKKKTFYDFGEILNEKLLVKLKEHKILNLAQVSRIKSVMNRYNQIVTDKGPDSPFNYAALIASCLVCLNKNQFVALLNGTCDAIKSANFDFKNFVENLFEIQIKISKSKSTVQVDGEFFKLSAKGFKIATILIAAL